MSRNVSNRKSFILVCEYKIVFQTSSTLKSAVSVQTILVSNYATGHRVVIYKSYLQVEGRHKTIFLFTADDKKELEDTKKRYNELSEKLMEKNRQYLKLQVTYFMCSFVA